MNAKLKELYNNGLVWIKSFFGILLVFLLAFLFRYFLIVANPYIQTDEPSTFYISSPSVVSESSAFFKKDWGNFNIEKQRFYSGAEFNNLLFKPDSSIKSMLEDLRLTRLQTMDRQHPSLYFSLVRIWDNYLGDFDKDKYLIHARKLNLVFFCLSFFFLYKLLALIKDDKNFITLALVFAFFNVGSISLAVLAREYALQEAFFILVTYFALILFKKIDSNEKITIKTTILGALAFALFLDSGYFSVVYFVMLGTLLLIKSALKNPRAILNLIIMFLLSIIFTWVLCPNYFDFKTNNEHYSSVASAFSVIGFFVDTKVLETSFIYLLKNLLYPFILYLVSLIVLLSRFDLIVLEESFTKKEKNVVSCLVLLAAFWIFGVLFLTPYKCLRYFAAGIPIFSLIILLMFSQIKLYMRRILAVAFVMFTLITYTTGVWYDTYDRSVIYQEETTNSLPSVVINPTFFFLDYAFLSLNENNTVRFEGKNNLNSLPIKGLYKLVCDENTRPKTKATPKNIWNMRVYIMSNPNS